MDEALGSVESQKPDPKGSSRSDEAAKATTKSFADDEKAPLASQTNPASKPGITFAAQDKLPKLPIPDLESTCTKYLAALDPLQTAREHAESERAVQEFLRSEGPDLQEKLKQYSQGKSSYIEQFCKSNYAHRLILRANL